MLRFALLFVFLAGPSFGQMPSNVCPNISVTGPAGIWVPGQTITFTVRLTGAESESLRYEWTVNEGEIITGQGKRTIEVRTPAEYRSGNQSATAKVAGLPPGCPDTATETAPYCPPPPQAEKISELETDADAAIRAELEIAALRMARFPNDGLYIQIGTKDGWTEDDAKLFESKVINALPRQTGQLHDPRITIVRCGINDMSVTIWRVPPGAENPECNSGITYVLQPGANPTEPECPEITVTGPAGVMRPGHNLIFTANMNYAKRDELVFRWMTTGGKIVGGQGTQSITIATSDADHLTNITALLSVIGLDRSCKATAEETARVEGGGNPIVLSEFGPMAPDKMRLRLDRIVPTFKEHPTSVLYFVVNPATNDTPKRIEEYEKLVRNHLEKKHRIPKSQIVFANLDPTQARSTKIYLVPSYYSRPQP